MKAIIPLTNFGLFAGRSAAFFFLSGSLAKAADTAKRKGNGLDAEKRRPHPQSLATLRN